MLSALLVRSSKRGCGRLSRSFALPADELTGDPSGVMRNLASRRLVRAGVTT